MDNVLISPPWARPVLSASIHAVVCASQEEEDVSKKMARRAWRRRSALRDWRNNACGGGAPLADRWTQRRPGSSLRRVESGDKVRRPRRILNSAGSRSLSGMPQLPVPTKYQTICSSHDDHKEEAGRTGVQRKCRTGAHKCTCGGRSQGMQVRIRACPRTEGPRLRLPGPFSNLRRNYTYYNPFTLVVGWSIAVR